MASLVVNRGLQMYGNRGSGITGTNSSAIVSMVVDSKSGTIGATDTTIAASTKLAKAFDATPTRSAQTVTHVTTFTTTQANFTIRRITLHNLAAASVTSGSSSLCAGIDGQAFTKTTSFSLEFSVAVALTSS